MTVRHKMRNHRNRYRRRVDHTYIVTSYECVSNVAMKDNDG